MLLDYINKDDLASKGLGYKVDKIEIRGLTNDEIVLLAMTDFHNLENVLENLIKNNKIVTNINYKDLYDMDKYIILYKIRELTFTTADYKISFVCPHCDKDNDFILNTSNDLLIDTWNGKNIEIPIKREDKEFNISIRPSLFSDRISKDLIQGFDDVSEEKANLASSIVELSIQESYELITDKAIDSKLGKLKPLELAHIISAYGKINSHGFKSYINKKVCKHCGGDVQNIPFQMGFIDFIPAL